MSAIVLDEGRPEGSDPDRPVAFLVSTTGCARDIRRYMGSADYSYVFVLNAFRPLLEALGTCRILEAPESRLPRAAAQAAADGFRPVHLAMQPPQSAYFTPAVPTVLFPFWEFPEVPDRDFGLDTRQNWARLCRPASLILTACRFTAEAFRRAGVPATVEVVPVPLPPEPFRTPAWDPDHSWTLECRHLVWGGDPGPAPAIPGQRPAESAPRPRGLAVLKHALRDRYRRHIRPWLSDEAIERISDAQKAILGLPETPPPLLPRGPLTLSGLVYTTVFNFSDRRKNARDLLTAFLLAFRDRPDVTLVLKMATSPSREFHELKELRQLYAGLGLSHRCRVAVVTEFLSDEQLGELFRASTYYVNASRAEGACLPLQQAMASGRPALAPVHTAMADYIDDRVGFPLESYPEPTFWPHDPEHRFATSWHRLVWSSLRDRFLESAAIAASDRATYDALAAAARERMEGYAGRAVVARALSRALGRLPDTPAGALDWAA
jgi:glycosyltransferase involved in cell wall biosynthesis